MVFVKKNFTMFIYTNVKNSIIFHIIKFIFVKKLVIYPNILNHNNTEVIGITNILLKKLMIENLLK
jgi:hypothetical protein